MRPATKFPEKSFRRAVADYGDTWAEPRTVSDIDLWVMYETRRAELRDADVMRRCAITMDRGTAFDPRVWIGVPSTERPA